MFKSVFGFLDPHENGSKPQLRIRMQTSSITESEKADYR